MILLVIYRMQYNLSVPIKLLLHIVFVAHFHLSEEGYGRLITVAANLYPFCERIPSCVVIG